MYEFKNGSGTNQCVSTLCRRVPGMAYRFSCCIFQPKYIRNTIKLLKGVPKTFLMCRAMYLLGYIPKDDRIYLGDKELNIISYSLMLSVLEYQTAVMRRDFRVADRILPTIPKEQRMRVAYFLEKQVWLSSNFLFTPLFFSFRWK